MWLWQWCDGNYHDISTSSTNLEMWGDDSQTIILGKTASFFPWRNSTCSIFEIINAPLSTIAHWKEKKKGEKETQKFIYFFHWKEKDSSFFGKKQQNIKQTQQLLLWWTNKTNECNYTNVLHIDAWSMRSTSPFSILLLHAPEEGLPYFQHHQ